MIRWLLWLATVFAAYDVAVAQNCTTGGIGYNLGLYYPASMSERVCGYQCYQQGLSYQYAAIYQGSVCFCQTVVGTSIDPSECNVTCRASASFCGDPTGVYANVYSVPCLPAISNLSSSSNIVVGSATPILAQLSCTRVTPSPVIFSGLSIYFAGKNVNELPLGLPGNFSSRIASLLYAYRSPGYIALAASVTTTAGDRGSTTSVAQVGSSVGSLSAIPVYYVFYNTLFAMQITVSAVTSGNFTVSMGTGSPISDMVLSSQYFQVGNTNMVASGIVDTNVWLMPSLAMTMNASLIDVRLRLSQTWSSLSENTMYLQIYRPSCTAGQYYCYLSNSCVNMLTVCNTTSATKQVCGGSAMYSLSQRNCISTSTLQPVASSVATNLPFSGSYLLQYDVFINLTNLTLLSTTSGDYMASLANQNIVLQPGDLPAVYVPDTSGHVLAVGAGNACKATTATITNFNIRNTSSVATYPTVSCCSSISQTSTIPLMSLTFARPVNVSVSYKYTTHSCSATPIGCYNYDNYTAVATVTNAWSSSGVTGSIIVLLPISGLTFTFQPTVCTTFQKCNLTVAAHGGSIPTRFLNFGDYQGNVTNVSDLVPVQHVYTLAGTYNPIVFAYNPLSQMNYSSPILAQDTIQGLQIIPSMYPAGGFGMHVNFILSVAQGSNATYVISFGDGSPPVVLSNLDASTAPLQLPYAANFIPIGYVIPLDSPTFSINISVASVEGCAKLCLTSTTGNFSCQKFLLNKTVCNLYSHVIYTSPNLNLVYSVTGLTLYSLKNQTCAADLLTLIPYSVNTTTGTASIRMNETGWNVSQNQSAMITFASFVQLNVMLVASTNFTRFSVFISNNTFTWTQYSTNNASVNTTFMNASQSVVFVLDPPIVTRYLRIVAMPGDSTTTMKFAFSGCQMQAMTYNLTHTISNMNSSKVLSVTVNATNLVSASQITFPYFVDLFIQNLTLSTPSFPLFTYTNGTLPFSVSGSWGSFLRIVIMRQDNFVLVNQTYNTYQPVYNYNITFYDPGMWTLTVYADNYIGITQNTLISSVLTIMYVSAGCNTPYVDVVIPNACSMSAGTCDTSSANLKYNALLVNRGASFTLNSNTTNNCPRPAVFTWQIRKYNSATNTFQDYTPSINSVYNTRYSTQPPMILNGSLLTSLTFSPRVFAIGLYSYSLTLTVPPNLTGINTTYMQFQVLAWTSTSYFSVVSTPLIPCVNNFTNSVGSLWDQYINITLDASCSIDPDRWPDEPQTISYSWLCFRQCEAAPRLDANNNFVQWNNGTNPYSTNCGPPDNLVNSSTPYSNQGCFLPVGIHKSGPVTSRSFTDWNSTNPNNPMKVDASSNTIYMKYWPYFMTSDGSVLTLNSFMMFVQTQHIFILVIRTGDGRVTQTLVTVSIGAVLPPSVRVDCVANCYAPSIVSPITTQLIVDPMSSFKSSITVVNYNPLLTYNYKWTICNTSGNLTKGTNLTEISLLLNSAPANVVPYDWSHASTSFNSPGLSFDTNFPVFPKDYYDCLLALVASVSLVLGKNTITSYSYTLFVVNSPPHVGDIVVRASPSSGTALNTAYTLSCSGGKTNQMPLLYSMGYTTIMPPTEMDQTVALSFSSYCTWLAVQQRTCAPTSPVQLAAGNQTANYTMYICIGVMDAVGSYAYTFQPALRVSPVQASAALAAVSSTSAVTNMASNNPGMFQALAFAFISSINPTASTSTASSVAASNGTSGASNVTTTTAAPVTTTTPSPEQVAEEKKAAANAVGTLVSAVSQMPPPSSLAAVGQTGSLLAALTQNPDHMLTSTISTTVDVAITLTSNLANLATSGSSTNQVQAVSGSIIDSLFNVLSATKAIQSNINSTDDTGAESSNPLSSASLKSQSDSINQAINSVAQTVLKMKVVDEKMSVINERLGVQLLTTSKVTEMTIELNSSSCTSFFIGSSDAFFAPFANMTPAAVQFVNTMNNANQYSWLSDSTSMKQTQSMSLQTADGADYNITNATGDKMFEIWLDTQLNPFDISPLNLNTTPYTLPVSQLMLTHKVPIKANTDLFVNVQHYLNWTIVPVNVTINGTTTIQYVSVLQNNMSYNGSNIMFIVYVQKKTKPTDDNYLANCTVPNFDPSYLSCARKALNMTNADPNWVFSYLADLTNMNYYSKLTEEVSNRCSRFSKAFLNPWTCTFPSKTLNNTVDTTYYVGVRSVMWNWTLPVQNGSYNPNITSPKAPTSDGAVNPGTGKPGAWQYLQLNYTFFAYYAGCFFYDQNIQDFSTAGCTVGKCSSPYATQCYCTHLTSFSNLFKLPVIKFDISSLNINALNDSPGVMCFLVAIICTYLVTWIWARYADLQAEDKLGVAYIPSNKPEDQYGYEITVWTGHVPGSGTTANVSVVLTGDYGDTAPRWLCDTTPERIPFNSGGINVFLLTSSTWLGTLSHLRIWHDNTGKHPSWYLLRVLVRDVYTNTKYYFIVNAWFSAEKEGIVDRLIPVAGKEELQGFEHVFWTRTANNLLNGHMWMSVATRPTRSRFTRVQRLTCCLVMCLTAVLFNLLGYIIKMASNAELLTSTEDPDPPIISLGPISISAYTLTISLISAGCTIPVNMIIVMLFQQRRIRQPLITAQNPYIRFRTAELTDEEKAEQEEREKQEEVEEELKKGACRKFLDRVSLCLVACMRKIFPLPWWSHYVAYTLAFLTVITAFMCAAILAYSNLPQAWQQNAWLSSIILSLVQSIFIIQPLQIFAIILVFSVVLKIPQEDEDEMSKEIAISRPLVEIPAEADPNQANIVKPPPFVAITESISQRKKKEEEMQSQLTGLLMYIAFLVILFVAVYMFVSPWRFYQFSNSFEQLRLQHPYQDQQALLNVSDVWNYISVRVLPFLYALKSSASVSNGSAAASNAFYTADGSSFLLGAQLRQVRVAMNECTVPDLLTNLIPYCYGEYSVYDADTENYLVGWQPIAYGYFSNETSAFQYTGSANTFGAFVQDLFGGIGGNGYIANLSNTMQQSKAIVANLSASGWLDARTRKLYIEFLAFNPNTYMYTVGFGKLQLSPTGIIYEPRLYTLLLSRYEDASGQLRLLAEAITAFILLVFVIRTLVELCEGPKQFIQETWKVFDLFTSISIIISLIVYAIEVVVALYAEGKIQQSPVRFYDLQLVCELDMLSIFFVSFTAFLLNLRLLKWFSLHWRLQLIADILAHGSALLAANVIQLIVIALAFAQAFFLLYFNYFSRYSTFASALLAQCTALLYGFSYGPLESSDNLVGLILFTAYVILVVFVVMRLFIPIVSSSVRETRLKYTEGGHERENPVTYFLWKLKVFFGFEGRNRDDDNFQYLTGAMDYEEVCKSFEERVSDFSSRVSTTEELKEPKDETVRRRKKSGIIAT